MSDGTRRRLGRPALVAAAVAVLASLVVPVVPASAAPITVPETPRAGISFNGTVYAVVLSGDVAYAGGSFTSVTGTNGTFSRSRLAALDLRTGAVTAFRADANATVRALALGAGALFVGGDFTRVHGTARGRLAEVDPASGALRATHRDANATVRALATTGDRLYVGGDFSSLGGASRARMGALALATRGVEPAFAPSFNGSVNAITTTPDGSVVYVGGGFTRVGGSSTRRYLVSLTRTGSVRAPVFALGPENSVLSLDTDGTTARLFAGVGGDSTGNQVASFDPVTGAKRWFQRGDGDVQAIAYHGGNVYFGFHEGFGGDTSVRLLAVDAGTGALERAFRPRMNSFWGVWALAASARGVVAGGEFTTVNGVSAGRLAFFDAAQPPPPPPPPPPSTAPPPTITGLAAVGDAPPVVVMTPQGATSRTPSVLVRVTWSDAAEPLGSTTLTGTPPKGAAAPLRFAATCGASATCGVASRAATATVPLSFGPGAGRLDARRATVLANPGVYGFRPTVTTAAGDVIAYTGPALAVRYLRATRITSFNAAPEPVRAGSTVRLTGFASKATVCAAGSRAVACRDGQLGRWAPIVRRSVRLYFDPVGPAPARLVTTTVPDSSGRFAVRARQDVAGRWRAELPQTAEFGAARSRSDLVRVRG